MPANHTPYFPPTPRGRRCRNRLLRTTQTRRDRPHTGRRYGTGRRRKRQNSPIPRQTAKKRRNRHIHHPQSGNRQFRPFVFTRRPHTLLSQSARRLRLFLLILHDTLRPGQKPQRTHRRPCGAKPVTWLVKAVMRSF